MPNQTQDTRRRVDLEPPLIITRKQLEAELSASDDFIARGESGDIVIYSYKPEIDDSGDGILVGSADLVREDGNGVWVETDGSENYG